MSSVSSFLRAHPAVMSPPLSKARTVTSRSQSRPQRPGTHASPLRPLALHASEPNVAALDTVESPNRYEDSDLPLKEHQRPRIVQNVTSYIRFFCGTVRHTYSLADVEALVAQPVVLPLDLHETHADVWEMLQHFSLCCATAGIAPVAWFDILTAWKPRLSRALTFAEFSLGLQRLFDEVNAQPLSAEETERLFRFFLRDTDNNDVDKEESASLSLSQQSIRRRDFQVGLKKQSLSQRRIAWFNHQARILSQCQRFLSRLNLRLRDLSLQITRSQGRKQRVNALEVEHLVSLLLSDYVAFVNCRDVDALLQQDEQQKQDKARALREHEERQRAVEEETLRRARHAHFHRFHRRRRTLEGSDGTVDIFDDAHDKHEDDGNIELGDDMSTFSVWDNMSEVSGVSSSKHSLTSQVAPPAQLAPLTLPLPHHSERLSRSQSHSPAGARPPRLFVDTSPAVARKSFSHKHGLTPHCAHATPKHTHFNFSHAAAPQSSTTSTSQKSLRARRRVDPVDLHTLERTASEENIDANAQFMTHLTSEEAAQLQQLVSRLKVGQPDKDDASLSAEHSYDDSSCYSSDGEDDDEAARDALDALRVAEAEDVLSFLESSAQRSQRIVREQWLLRLYSKQVQHDAQKKQKHKKKIHFNLPPAGEKPISAPRSLDPTHDLYAHDEHFQLARNADPSLTPSAFHEEYTAFESSMRDKQQKHQQYYKVITDHFDRRVTHTQRRLAKAKKTGI